MSEFTRRTVTLEKIDEDIVQAADTNRAGFSATLRRIVREWEARRDRYQYDPDGPQAYGRDRVQEVG